MVSAYARFFRFRPAFAFAPIIMIMAGYTSASAGPRRDEFTILVAGDAILTRPWSHVATTGFKQLVEALRSADVAIANLELVLTDFNGFPQAHSGGGYLAARPAIATELAWAGIDMLAAANNHAFDYGSLGVIETVEAAKRAGLVIAGVGKDLQGARRPGYLQHPEADVALVSTASSFVPYGIASKSSAELHGRPGLNPLAVSIDVKLVRLFSEVQRNSLDLLARIGLSLRGIEVRTIDTTDKAANLQSVRMAQQKADYVVVSVHAHNPGLWLEDFAHEAIDAGADVFFSHGPHTLGAIELYRGKPIFYGLGNFIFQIELIEKLPSEVYDRFGLGPNAKPEDVFSVANARQGSQAFPARREVWESVVAAVTFTGKRVKAIRLLPIDLGFGKPVTRRGRPQLAAPPLARRIIEDLAERSRRFGAKVRYLAEKGVGLVLTESF